MNGPLHGLVLATAIMAAACEAHYAYVPTTSATPLAAGRPAAEYAIPPEAPRGRVQIASYGIVDAKPGDASEAKPIRALHLRLIVSNDSDRAWSLDTRDQRIELDGHGASAPAFASADAGSPPPNLTVEPKGRRTVDLFFPLPTKLQDADELPQFDALWRVSTGTVTVIERTPFARLNVEPGPAYLREDYGLHYDWGPPYWYDPLYSDHAFVGVVIVPHRYVGHPIVVHRPPPHVHFRGRR